MKDEIEIWKDIIGYEGIYQVSNLGNVKSLGRKSLTEYYDINLKEKILKKGVDSWGYFAVKLYKNGTKKSFKVHKLVALNFIENKHLKPQVNHINGVKSDNRINNLEWVTSKENMIHAHKIGLMNKRIDIVCKKVIDTNSGMIFDSIRSASNYSLIKYGTLRAQLSGENKNRTTFKFL